MGMGLLCLCTFTNVSTCVCMCVSVMDACGCMCFKLAAHNSFYFLHSNEFYCYTYLVRSFTTRADYRKRYK